MISSSLINIFSLVRKVIVSLLEREISFVLSKPIPIGAWLGSASRSVPAAVGIQPLAKQPNFAR